MDEPSESLTTLADGTVNFLPNRLNRQPIVVMGLTANEVMIVSGGSIAAGFLLGIPLGILTKSIAMVPTLGLICAVLGLMVAGRVLRRLKRNRPDDWFYRNLQWRITQRCSFLITWVGGSELITRSGVWFHRRDA